MAQKCTKCSKDIINRQFLTCVLCEKSYHLDCTNVSFQRFSIMTTKNKKSYRCDQCWSKLEVFTNLNNSSTQDPNVHESPNDQNFVTHRNKYNIPTQNSFELLSDDEEEYSSLPGTPITINRSCPEMRPNNICEVEALQQEIRNLKEKLGTAENEIDSLLSENHVMSKKITEYELQINKLTHICKSTSINNSHSKSSNKVNSQSKKRTGIIKTQLDFSALVRECNQEYVADIPAPETEHVTIFEKNNVSKQSKQLLRGTSLSCNSTPGGATEPKKRIHIVGDEQLKGLSAALISSRKEKWNDVYKPSSLILSGATSTDILNYCDNIASNLCNDDIVILGCGSNDKDIHTLHSNICIALNKLKKVTVFIAPINYNPYINFKTLNINLKLWTKHFINCTVIDMNFYIRNDNYVKYICNKLNICIDYFEYKKQYLTSESIKRHLKGTITQSKKFEQISTQELYKKGTIPYYFSVKPYEPLNNLDNGEKLKVATEKPSQSNAKTFFRS